MNNSPPDFGRLVLFCIEADFCVQIRILQHFARSTHSAFFSRAKFLKFSKIFENFPNFFPNFWANFDKFFSRSYLILARKMFNFSCCKCLRFCRDPTDDTITASDSEQMSFRPRALRGTTLFVLGLG